MKLDELMYMCKMDIQFLVVKVSLGGDQLVLGMLPFKYSTTVLE